MIEIPELIGASAGIVAVRKQLERLLRHQAARMPPILIQGETGTGKGLLARAVHRSGPRRGGPFVDVNCAAIPETLLEAEMFGFERGAFTDARQAKPGLLEAAHHGTLFLDEVGLLPEPLQAKLLKAIEEQVIRRLGSTRNQPIDVWVVSATSEDLTARTRTRRFREDLYHRLALLTIDLPPLRERDGDVELLADHFLRRVCAEYGLAPRRLDAAALAALRAHDWPGNVRELANLIERAVLLSDGDVLTAGRLGLDASAGTSPTAGSLHREMTSLERARVVDALQQTGWNVSRAAELLGISRNKLRYRIARYRLQPGARAVIVRSPAPVAPVEPAEPAVTPLPVRPPALRWESRRLVLVQVRLVASAEHRSASDAADLLEEIVDKLRGFGGHVEELSPTGLLAAFGMDAAEDVSTRAALSAIAAVHAAQGARRAGHSTCSIAVALHVDHVMVGRLDPVVQLDAERKPQLRAVLDGLLAVGAPDTITLSIGAARLLERRFDVAPVGEPGTPARVYRLAGGERAGLRRATRFVGRDAELRFLRERLAAAVGGRGQVVGISGDPGIGKSRLLDEFQRSLGDGEVTWLEGRCFSYLTATPYAPVIQMLRATLGLGETDGEAVVADKARRALVQVGMDPDEAVPYLLLVLGVGEGTEGIAALSADAIRGRTFDILTEMTLRGSQRRPLVLVAEDLHWIDTASESFLTVFVERMAGAPVLLLVTYRPGYRPPGMDRSYATQIALSPLTHEESLRMVQGMRGLLPEPVANLILARAEGNPLFLEELARAAGEQDADPGDGVPSTLQEVLLARVDRLPEQARRVLRAAAVLGRECPARLLAAMAEAEPQPEVDAALRELSRLEFLVLRSAVEEPVYVFKHVLTQEAVRDSLEPSQRRALHAAAGRALERLHGERLEQVYDRLAYHHANAGDTEKAIDYLTRFAARAVRASAHVESAAALEEALLHAARLPDGRARDRLRLQLVLQRVHPLTLLGRFREVLDGLLDERDRVERLGDPVVAGPYHFWVGRTYGVLGDQERAVEAARRALEHAQHCGDSATAGKAYYVLAYADYWQGRPRAGIEHGRQAVTLLEGTDERFWLGLAHWVVAISHAHIGEFQHGLAAVGRAEAIAEETGDPQLRCTVAWSSGMMLAGQGSYEVGIAACRRAVETSPNPVNSALATGLLGACYLERGDAGRAIPLLEESVERLGHFQVRQTQGWHLALLAEAHLLSGNPERAGELAAQGLRVSRDAGYAYGAGWAQRALGRVAVARRSPEEGRTRFTDALHTFASVEARFEEARTHMALAQLARAQGDGAAADRHRAEALDRLRSLEAAHYVARLEERSASAGH